MSGESIGFLVSGIVCILGLLGAIVGYGYRAQHPYSPMDLERSNWFTRWIKSNFNLFMWIVIIMIALCAIAFFVAFSATLK